MEHYLKLAGISILADIPFSLIPDSATDDFFRSSPPDRVDLRLEFRPVEALPEPEEILFEKSRELYVRQQEAPGMFFRTYPRSAPFAFVSRRTVKDGHLRCEYLPGNEKYMPYAPNILRFMGLEATLLDFNALILHASLIRWNGQSVIFSAPCGTGKSTQAELWERYEGADILNGDRAALRQIAGVWTAFGLPYAGSSGIYRNESAPLTAIVALRQAPENRIRQIHGAEAFRYLYPETTIHRWDDDFERRATDLLLQLLTDIPVYLLECRPDREAVELLRDTIQKDMTP